MTIDELFEREKERLLKLANYYARAFCLDREDIFQEGVLALTEIYRKYAGKLPDKELVWVIRRVTNRKMYKYVNEEVKRKYVER